MARRGTTAAGLALYALTLGCELPAAYARLYLAYGLVWFYTEADGGAAGYRWPIAYMLGFAPLVWSLAALVWPAASDWLWRVRCGGRAPSERERLAYEAALGELTGVPPPRRWFVVDDQSAAAAVCGDTLMLTRGMLDEPTLGAVIAHELFHISTIDGRLTAALNALVLRARRGRPGRIRAALGWLVRGGGGQRLLAPAWGAWWREREHEADRFAAALGKSDELASYLELHALVYERPLAFGWLAGRDHPPVAHRIERLEREATR